MGRRAIIIACAALAMAPAVRATLPAHRGGTLRLVAGTAFGTIDPTLNYALGFAEVFTVTYDGLVAFRKSDGPSSNDTVPDLADSLPAPTDSGRTYTFHLRDGPRFSNGAAVTVADVVATFQRIFKVGSPGSAFFSVIVGADACLRAPATCTLAGGISADAQARTITFHLTRPDPEFFDKLAISLSSIVPADTPPHDIGGMPTPATGPYMIASYDPNRHMTLTRNPYFRQWSADAQPDGYVDRIEYDFGLADESQITAVENNQYDWMYDEKPLDRLGELGNRFTARTHVTVVPQTMYLAMNTNLYPFNNALAREAVNYAVDRRAIAIFKGGPGAAAPICHVLPADFPGSAPYCPFTRGADIAHPAATWQAPDLARARRLVAQSGTKGARITLVTPNYAFTLAMGAYLQSMLRGLGYDASLRALDFNIQFNYIQNTNNKVQISLTDWSADYPAASDFLRILYGCGSFHPGSDSSNNIPGYCDHALDAEMAAADAATLIDPARGNALWAKVDRDVTNLSLAADLIQDKWIDIVSIRLGNYTFSQINHMIFSKVWVR